MVQNNIVSLFLVSDLLQPDLLEDVIVSVCLKQHGLESALQLLGQSENRTTSSSSSSSSSSSTVAGSSSSNSTVASSSSSSSTVASSSGDSSNSTVASTVGGGTADEVEEHYLLLDAVFTRINGLERRLQVITHMHQYHSFISSLPHLFIFSVTRF